MFPPLSQSLFFYFVIAYLSFLSLSHFLFGFVLTIKCFPPGVGLKPCFQRVTFSKALCYVEQPRKGTPKYQSRWERTSLSFNYHNLFSNMFFSFFSLGLVSVPLDFPCFAISVLSQSFLLSASFPRIILSFSHILLLPPDT